MIKPSIIILHGWKLSSDKYQKLQRIFNDKGYKVFAPDLPGFGKNSQVNKIYSLEDYADFVLNYVKKNKINSTILLGHSFGGRISLVIGAKHPSLIKYLVLTGVPGYLPAKKFKVNFFYYLAKIGKLIFCVFPFSLFAARARKLLYKSAGVFDYYHTSGYLRETFKKVIGTDLEPYMKMIKTPTLLIWGKEDKITPVWIAEKMHRNIINSKIIILPNEGHGLIYKNPKLFTKYVL